MSTDFVPTKASLLKNKPPEYKEVTFVARKPKQKNEHPEVSKQQPENTIKNAFDMKKTRHEIFNFVMSGLDPVDKKEAKIQQLIKLGAKPPKNKYKNYKELTQQLKLEKQKKKQEEEFQQLGKNKAGKSTAKGKSFDRKRRKKDGILNVYGKILKSKNAGDKK